MADGSIRLEHAYAQGKMLNHANWYGYLKDYSTFIDHDMVRDIGGRVFEYVELKRGDRSGKPFSLSDMNGGQRFHYQSLLLNSSHGKLNILVTATHDTPVNLEIDTREHVFAFRVAYALNGFIDESIAMPNEYWHRFNRDIEADGLDVFMLCEILKRYEYELTASR